MDTLQPRLHPREWTGEQLCQGLLSSLFMPGREWGIENLQDLLLPATHSHCAPFKAKVAFSTFYLQSQVLETFSKMYRVKQCHELGSNQEQIWFIFTVASVLVKPYNFFHIYQRLQCPRVSHYIFLVLSLAHGKEISTKTGGTLKQMFWYMRRGYKKIFFCEMNVWFEVNDTE